MSTAHIMLLGLAAMCLIDGVGIEEETNPNRPTQLESQGWLAKSWESYNMFSGSLGRHSGRRATKVTGNVEKLDKSWGL